MQARAHGVLQDLQAAKQHNGQEVVLERWMVEKERWKCRLADGTQVLYKLISTHLTDYALYTT